MDQKGALAGDFILAFFITIIISLGLISLVSDRIDHTNDTEKLSKARLLTEKIASAINDVQTGTGNEIKIKMPEKIGNSSDYIISINSSGVYIEIEGLKGKSEIYPTVIINEITKSSSPVKLYPGKSYLIQNDPSNIHLKAIIIKECEK
ncbi:MAG: hypothetical protein Q7U35_05155 [Methanobacteriaceae archaeon]|nr:hypothetical protein [Methanobacteriaceae archaeon]MDP2835603.1 hypothetical protein [Methanobacteriaceae archaeon]MDP3033798.1 hypothetical protein [Methanobacteriaceae archaeon]MDP3484588.1 hypothetical protein [Methanobacteriaceae archaeon]MDP3624500.1 hypothetical protein [Methanobacteriaceae archaeon]